MTRPPLGMKSDYISTYTPTLLFPIPRKIKRDEINVPTKLPFTGYDFWTAYEVSWLNKKGLPQVAIANICVPCDSENLIESKSLKLYLNSFNQTKFESKEIVQELIANDLTKCAVSKEQVAVRLKMPDEWTYERIGHLSGTCLDNQDIEIHTYEPNPKLLSSDKKNIVEEALVSHLLKSNCLVTFQPDWGSLQISYKGPKIDHEGLLRYIVSFRNHNEFHEQCIERIFVDILRQCEPEKLTVYGRYTRRGGLDINPFRTTESGKVPENMRLARQ